MLAVLYNLFVFTFLHYTHVVNRQPLSVRDYGDIMCNNIRGNSRKMWWYVVCHAPDTRWSIARPGNKKKKGKMAEDSF